MHSLSLLANMSLTTPRMDRPSLCQMLSKKSLPRRNMTMFWRNCGIKRESPIKIFGISRNLLSLQKLLVSSNLRLMPLRQSESLMAMFMIMSNQRLPAASRCRRKWPRQRRRIITSALYRCMILKRKLMLLFQSSPMACALVKNNPPGQERLRMP